ncbi:MAG TPA: sulfite exporter TauE/SafE family protein [Candidatus Baltobacteraceae bacterium]|nr:sulfite exporter TauE/SafE family protein [Candidatus Baltobacteraceae bacterium]
MSVFLIAVVGFAVGTVVGLTGVGGASLMTPILMALGLNPLAAVGSDLAMTVPSRLYSAALHYRNGNVNLGIVKALCAGGIPAAIAGLLVLHWVRQVVDLHTIHTWISRSIGACLFLAAALIVAGAFYKPAADGSDRSRSSRALTLRIVAIGAVVGFIVTITSIGSGSLTLPLLAIFSPAIALPELIGSDIVFSAVLVPVAAAGHWSMGDVHPWLALNLLAGALPGTYFGTKWCRALHQRWLRPAVALVLVVAGTRLLAI